MSTQNPSFGQLPRHVALILDGNGRWAEARGLPRTAGHERGAAAAKRAVWACLERRVPTTTLYAFSVGNWSRPKEETDALMRICADFAEGEREAYVERGVRVVPIGELEDLPNRTRRAVERLAADTEGGAAMTLGLAVNYGGRRDVVSAVRALAVRARAGVVIPEEIDEQTIRSFMTTSPLPDPDLLIRTGGERRLSDFLLFECAHSELFFSEILWPDFDEATLDEALATFARRRTRKPAVARA